MTKTSRNTILYVIAIALLSAWFYVSFPGSPVDTVLPVVFGIIGYIVATS